MKRQWKKGMQFVASAVLAVVCIVLAYANTATAANPTTMSFQGKVVNADGTNVANGTYGFSFKLYSVPSGGTAIWTETQSSVTVTAGTFQVNLGSVCPLFTANACNNTTPIDFNAVSSMHLGITFNSDPAGEMIPRVQLQSVPFAYQADNASKVGGLAVSQLVQLSPSSQQTGTVNVSGSGTFGSGAVLGSTTTAASLLLTDGTINNRSINLTTPSLTGSYSLILPTTGPGTAQCLKSDSVTAAQLIFGSCSAGGDVFLANNQTFTGQNIFTGSGNGTTTSGTLFMNATNSATAFQIQNALANSNLFIANTLNSRVGMGVVPVTTLGAGLLQVGATNATTAAEGISFGGDTAANLYRSASGVTKTDGSFNIASKLTFVNDGDIRGSGIDYFDPSLMTGASTLVGSNGTAAGNFGGALSTGAFLANNPYYAIEFVAGAVAITTNNASIGDSGNWYYSNGGSTAGTSVSVQSVATTGGFLRLTTPATTARGAVVTTGATPGTQDKPLAAAQLPIVQMKVRPSILRVTDDIIWGMGDTAASTAINDTLPTNGIVFWSNNSTGAGGWTGVVRSGGATIGTPVVCPGGITANAFATGRIVVVNATTVRFFIDVNASDGISLVDCGIVTGALPAASMGLQMNVIHTVNTASTFDLDYARWWQDDAPITDVTEATNVVASQQMQADIATAQDPTTDLQAIVIDPASMTLDTPEALNSPVKEEKAEPEIVLNNDSVAVNENRQTFSFSFDSQGNAALNGGINAANISSSNGLIVGGEASFNGLSSFQKVATFFAKTVFRQDVQIDGHLAVGVDSAGYAQIRSSEQTVHVTFIKPYENPPIVNVTNTTEDFMPHRVHNITAKGFDISLKESATKDALFNWLAVGVNKPVTSASPIENIVSPPLEQ